MKIHNDLSGKEWYPGHKDVYKGYWQDVPKRLYISTRHGQWSIGARTQAWLPIYGYANYRKRHWFGWWWVAWHPRSDNTPDWLSWWSTRQMRREVSAMR